MAHIAGAREHEIASTSRLDSKFSVIYGAATVNVITRRRRRRRRRRRMRRMRRKGRRRRSRRRRRRGNRTSRFHPDLPLH